jgi:hypothetical protein
MAFCSTAVTVNYVILIWKCSHNMLITVIDCYYKIACQNVTVMNGVLGLTRQLALADKSVWIQDPKWAQFLELVPLIITIRTPPPFNLIPGHAQTSLTLWLIGIVALLYGFPILVQTTIGDSNIVTRAI